MTYSLITIHVLEIQGSYLLRFGRLEGRAGKVVVLSDECNKSDHKKCNKCQQILVKIKTTKLTLFIQQMKSMKALILQVQEHLHRHRPIHNSNECGTV